jgi:hypothetical protein
MSKKKTTAPKRKAKPWTKAEWDAWEDELTAKLLANKEDRDGDDTSSNDSLPELPSLGLGDTIVMFGVRRPAAKTAKPRKRAKAGPSKRKSRVAKSSRK